MDDIEAFQEGNADLLLRRLGIRAWMAVGILIIAVVTYLTLVIMSGIVVPTIVAVVMATLFGPLVDVLSKRMPRALAAVLVLGALVVVGVAVVAVAVAGIYDQAPLIAKQLTAGFEVVSSWFRDLGIDVGTGSDAAGDAGRLLSGAMAGLASYVPTVFSSVAAFVAGTLIAIFILYYMLLDWKGMSHWVGTHLGLRAELGLAIVDDATRLNQQYFYALTISGFVTGVVIGLAVWLLRLPLAFTIGIVTFLTSYIPFIGAIFSGAFAFLVALGSGDFTAALIVLAVVLIVQNVVQPLVQAKLNQDRIALHPVGTFASTIVGGVVAGLLGAALSAPVLATIFSITRRVRGHETAEDAARHDEPGDGS